MGSTPVSKAKTPDRRLVKTKKAIKAALIRLMSEKDISKINITELTEAADISRKTFYLHYSGICDVLDEIENEIVDGLIEVLREYDLLENRLNPYIILQSINSIVSDDISFYTYFVKSGAGKFLTQKVKCAFKQAIIQAVRKQTDVSDEVLSFTTEYTVSGIIALYIEWFESGSSMPLDELAALAGKIASEGLLSAIKG